MHRTEPELQYQLGQLIDEFDTLTVDCDNEHCNIYDIITTQGIRTKSFLRTVAQHQAHIDALQYALYQDHPPHEPDWVTGTTRQTLINVNDEIDTLVNDQHETQSVRVTYLTGWRHALRYVRDPEHRPFDAFVYRKPNPEQSFTAP